ncbi:MAG: CehA/McbA family metallohydrolase [Candidatus Heimdallarchaeota archaeon]|nr:CehA/McbA family metallohydrolase [Candidatus Heimdallarchaeota archaeon]
MDVWLNWVVGFVIWIGFILIIVLFTILITDVIPFLKFSKGRIPNNIFDYQFRPHLAPENSFLLDTHSHTTASDGWMTPEQLIKWEMANGFNAFVLTDHNTGINNNTILSLQEKYPEILIIPGYEWTTARIHLNFLGIMDFPKPESWDPSDEEIKSVIQQAHDQGALVQCNHISWTKNQGSHRVGKYIHPTRDQLYEWGIDGFEINNEIRWYDPKTLDWLELRKQEGKITRPVFLSTGTDIHNPLKEWASGWTQMLLSPEEQKNPSWEIIKKALLQGRTKIWVDHDFRQAKEAEKLGIGSRNWKTMIFAPFFGLSHGILEIPGGTRGIISYSLWLFLLYFPVRLLMLLISNL